MSLVDKVIRKEIHSKWNDLMIEETPAIVEITELDALLNDFNNSMNKLTNSLNQRNERVVTPLDEDESAQRRKNISFDKVAK